MARAFTGAGKFESDCVLICEILRRGGGSTGITAGEVLMTVYSVSGNQSEKKHG
jgi:hypothetical protein